MVTKDERNLHHIEWERNVAKAMGDDWQPTTFVRDRVKELQASSRYWYAAVRFCTLDREPDFHERRTAIEDQEYAAEKSRIARAYMGIE